MVPSSLGGLEKDHSLSFDNDNLRKLSDGEIPLYLDSLSKRLSSLSKVFDIEGDKFVASYVDIIKGTLDCFKLKYELKEQDKVDFPLTICQNDSGFPAETDFFLLEKNKEEAAEVLKILPEREEIIDKIRRAILGERSPVMGQMMLRRHNFYSKLSNSKILSGYYLRNAQQVEKRRGDSKGPRRLYTVEWACLERDSKIPVLYRLYLTQDERHEPLDKSKNPRLETIIYQTQMLNLDLSFLASRIDNEIEEVHPKLLERYRIGPFFCKFTKNSPKINELLEKDGDPTILKFGVEKILSEGTVEYGSFLEKLMGKKAEREVFSPVDAEGKIVTSFRIKQELSGKDDYGNACKVYGVTKEGNIV